MCGLVFSVFISVEICVSGILFWFVHGHRADVFNVDIGVGLVVSVVVGGDRDCEVGEVVVE